MKNITLAVICLLAVSISNKAIASNRSARVVVENQTSRPLKIQILHQYTGEATEQSQWTEIVSGGQKEMLGVHFHTGFGTTGVDNWIVNGVDRRGISANIQPPKGLPTVTIDGNLFVDINWNSGTGAFASWKVHTLRSEDDGQITRIVVHPTFVEFVSHSGTSSTNWNSEFRNIFPI